MTIKQVALAGTMESSDIMITLEPSEAEGLVIELDSAVEKQFGTGIRRVISETLQELGVTRAKVVAVDKGALDCAIRARVKTAAFRASGQSPECWGGEAR